MERSEIEQVLANWIEQATCPPGQLADGVDPPSWIASQFLRWWKTRAYESLDDAEGAVNRLRAELERLGGWTNPDLGEALHELAHLDISLAELSVQLGANGDRS